jgi:hypothetical protein
LKKLLSLVLLVSTGCLAAVDDPAQRGTIEITTGTGGTGMVGTGTGGSPIVGSGGAIGPVGSGGIFGTGGIQGTFGTGGRVGTGGVSAPDGGVGTDARPTPDGAATDARPVGTGGRPGSGGATSTGGVTGSGGRPGTGGTTATVCTSNVMWNGSTGPNMRPGSSCRGCHGYAIAGTVYPTLHEPTNCNGVNGSTGVRVVITGANGTVLTLTPNSAGNFFSNTAPSTPFTVRLTSNAGTRAMNTPQTSGDCNSCHTQNGSANGAPGRIMAP